MLLIDSGNSAIKCRLLKQQENIDTRFSHLGDPECRSLRDYLGSIEVNRVALASVSASNIQQQIVTAVHHCQPHATLIQVTSLPELNGLKNGYQDFTRLGVDRWLTFMAVTPLSHTDYIIIDAGSAITIDLLSRTKGHLGGAIIPGFNTHEERFKAMFPRVDFNNGVSYRPIEHPGKDTQSCIDISQAPFSVSGVISIVHKWFQLLQPPCEILLCGQDAELIRQELDMESRIVPDLVFRGMLKQIQLQG